MDAKSRSIKGLLYLGLILLSALCFTPFWLMIINATRSGNEIMTGFSLLPGSSLPTNWAIVSENMDMARGMTDRIYCRRKNTVAGLAMEGRISGQ